MLCHHGEQRKRKTRQLRTNADNKIQYDHTKLQNTFNIDNVILGYNEMYSSLNQTPAPTPFPKKGKCGFGR